jgi:hypothetical protein
MGIRSAIRSGCFLGAAALVIAAFVAPALAQEGADDPEKGRPPSWRAQVSATGIQVIANTDPPSVPVADVIRGDAADGLASWASDGEAKARASTFFPGVAFTEAPNLIYYQVLCANGFPCQPGSGPPTYPFTADAEYPKQPDASVASGQRSGGEGLAFGSGEAVAHAARDKVTTRAVMEDVRSGGATAETAVVSADKVIATTIQEFKDKLLVATSQARLDGVRIGGGAIRIDSIQVSSITKTDGDKVVQAETSATANGVTVGGQPARITEKGLEVGPSGGQGGDAIGALNNALQPQQQQSRFQVRLVGASKDIKGTTSKGLAQGVLVYAQGDLSALPSGTIPYNSYLLGNAGTLSTASLTESDLLAELPPLDAEAATDDGTFAATSGGAPFSTGTATTGERVQTGSETPASSPTRTGTTTSGDAEEVALATPQLIGRRWSLRLLYAAATLAFLGICLGGRRAIKPRFPSP